MAWAEDVIAGRVVAGPHVRNACQRHIKDLADGPARGLTWDLPAALRVIQFFPEVLRLASGQFEGLPFELHPFQKFIVGSLFGWKRADGTRRFRRAYIEAGKGSGKTPLASGIGMYCLVADGEARAEIYAAALMKSQAMVLFRDAVAMWQQSPALFRKLTPSGGNPVWSLTDISTGSFFRPISSDEGYSGPRPSCALCDEVHEHRNGRMIEMLELGFKFRRQPLLLMITNAGSDLHSVCWVEHFRAICVAAGHREADKDHTFIGEALDDTQFSFVCSLDTEDDPLENPSCWIKTNPLLGVTITPEYIAEKVKQAKAIPGKLNSILRLYFCIWTSSDVAWMSRAALEAVLADFDPADHAGEPVSLGVDLSAARDLTAVAFVVRTGSVDMPDENGAVKSLPTYDAWIEAWTPADTLAERALQDNMPYDLWVRDGQLNTCPGPHIRLDFVAARLAETASEYMIETLAYDRYVYFKLRDELDALGLQLNEVEHPQGGRRRARLPDAQIDAALADGKEEPRGLWMPGSIKELESLILDKRIRLRRNPVLISACMSAATGRDAFDNYWFEKRKATNRIDAVVSLAMAVGAATGTTQVSGDSMYEKQSLTLL